jgi:hypothetical protein
MTRDGQSSVRRSVGRNEANSVAQTCHPRRRRRRRGSNVDEEH